MTLVARIFGALTLHTAAVVYLTWPLAPYLGSHVGCPTPACHFDLRAAYWAQAWQVHALATHPASVLDAPIFHPAKHALLFVVLGLGSLPIFAPVYLVSGNPTLAGNVAWLGAIVLTATALHAVVRSWSGLESAGAIAGLTFLTTRWVYWDWIPVAPTYAALQYLPVIVWLLARPSLSTGMAGLLGVLLALQCSADLVYVALPVLAPTALVALWRLGLRATRADGLRIVGAIALATVLLLPLVAGYLDLRAGNPNLLHQTPWSWRARGTTLDDYLVGFNSPTSIAPAAAVLLLTGVAAAFAAGPVKPRAWQQIALWTVVSVGLSLGPTLRVGDRVVPNHVDRLARAVLPMLDAVRRPERMRAVALVGLCLLAGLAFATIVRAIRRRWLSGQRAAPLLAVAMAAALYVSARVGWAGRNALVPPDQGYPLVRAIGPADPVVVALRGGHGPVLELPANVTDVVPHARAMSRALWHWRPVLNGYGSYWPLGFDLRMGIAASLPDPAALRSLRRATGVATIVVHLNELQPAQRIAWETALAVPRDDFVSMRRLGQHLIVIEVGPHPPSAQAPAPSWP